MTYPQSCPYCDRIIPEEQYFCASCGQIVEGSPLKEPCPGCGFPHPVARKGKGRAWVKEHGPWYLGTVFVVGLFPSLRWLFFLGAIGTAAVFGLAFWVHRGVRRACPRCDLKY